jgi:ketosteroid isomerase-like protein
MNSFAGATLVSIFVCGAACSQAPRQSQSEINSDIDSLNASLIAAYRDSDSRSYAGLFTDSAVFEWPAFNTVRGRAGIEAMARSNWAALDDQELRLNVSSRRVAPEHAIEFGAFEQSWSDSSGLRMTEFGRYVVLLLRQADDRWLMDRFFGFADSTRAASPNP